MALVRVYCGLATADDTAGSPEAPAALTAAVVDASGRLLETFGLPDDTDGHAALTMLLTVRAAGSADVAIASQRADFLVAGLFSAAGQPLAVAGDEAAADHAERFADDDSAQEMSASPAARRAVGLARALQAGALWVAHLPAPPELSSAASLLHAQGALVAARQAAGQALRELLRQVYPAALRAFADPTTAACLAVLDALPEPAVARALAAGGRTGQAAAARLAEVRGVDRGAVDAAVTALRLAVAETERSDLAGADTTALMVRNAVAAIRAYDEAREAAVATLRAHVAGARFQARREALQAPRRGNAGQQHRPGGRAGRITAPPARRQLADQGPAPDTTAPVPSQRGTDEPPARRAPAPAAPAARRAPAGGEPGDAGQPFQPRLTRAAIERSRAERQARGAEPDAAPAPAAAHAAAPPTAPPAPKRSADTDRSVVDRANWPLVGSGDTDDYARPYRPRTAATSHPTPPPGPAARPGAVGAPGAGAPTADRPAAHAPQEPPPARPGGRVRPPWQADDLPEPPSLRLVEPPPLDDTALAPGHVAATQRIDLRHRYADPAPAPLPPAPPIPEGIASDNDGDLLIFAATRSAWFTARDAAAADVSWSFDADTGWRAAEEAAQPAIGDETQAGLPKRVPKANLVPGSPVTEERPLRIVRDPSSIAAHTTGYFRGWRRGQEIGGYAVGGRPGRDSAGGWEFSRASHADDADPEAAGYR